jgi:hypothetical protein
VGRPIGVSADVLFARNPRPLARYMVYCSLNTLEEGRWLVSTTGLNFTLKESYFSFDLYGFLSRSEVKNAFRCRLRLKCDGTRAETRFRLSAKRTSPFKLEGASVHSTTGSRGVRISSNDAGYTMFRGSVKSTGYPLHSPVSPSLPLPVSPCATTSAVPQTFTACSRTAL